MEYRININHDFMAGSLDEAVEPGQSLCQKKFQGY